MLSVGGASNATAQQLSGSDTLQDVTNDALVVSGLAGPLTYIGGGSSAGEAAMVGGSQHIAPMARGMNPALCTPSSQQLLVGLDGILVLAANQIGGDSEMLTPPTTDDCSDTISGGATLSVPGCTTIDGCKTAGQYTFANWNDVLAMIYGGQNHNGGAATIAAADGSCTYVLPPNEATADGACAAAGFPGEVCFPNNKCGNPALVGHRNPALINCLNPVRQALVNNYGSIFQDVAPIHSCRTGTCTRLHHAFRRDDLSDTTEEFVSLVGLAAIANPTKLAVGNLPEPDRAATANPFCNAGERPMNKGDADYLDLDPIRRSVDVQIMNGNRFGLEQVGELVPAFGGNNNDAACNLQNPAGSGVPIIPGDHSNSNEPGILPDPVLANSQAALQSDLGADSVNGGLLPVPYAPSTRLCLGLVLPIELPANYTTPQQAYWGDPNNSNIPVPCDTLVGNPPVVAVDFVSPDLLHGGTALCPNGTRQPCLMPFKVDPNSPNGRNFNCYQDRLNPNLSGVQDMRFYNVHPVDNTGHYLRDSYFNPNISVSRARQGRVVSAFYRLHTTHNTTGGGSMPTASFCQRLTSDAQIGCLVEADTCTIGYAQRAPTKLVVPGANFAFRLEGIIPSIGNIQNLVVPGATPVYPLSERMWLNSLNGFSTGTAAEMAFFQFESAVPLMDQVILAWDFVQVPSGVVRLRGCP